MLRDQDVVGRARTGMGKTLAFVLPIVERIFADNGASHATSRSRAVEACATGGTHHLALLAPFHCAAVSTQYGRKPLVMGLAPTRELAKQVCLDFESVSGKLETLSVYGGTQMYPQVRARCRVCCVQRVPHCASL